MAKIVPSDLTRLALCGAHEPEIETLAILRDTLPDDYTVFHGVHWTRQYKGRTLYGEIDFVVMNQAGRVLCIEQKNGRLDEAQRQLFKDYGDSRKNVGDQILRSIDNIRGKFAYQIGRTPRLEVEYLIYCPDYAVKQLAAAAVVLTDVDPREKQLAQELQILFCGLTRATVRLEIVCNAGNPSVQERILQHG